MGLFSNMFGGSVISPKDAREKMSELSNYVLLDVRTPAEFKEVRIKGAKLIPVSELEARAAIDLPDKNVPIFIYCKSGARAGSAVKILSGLGYTNAVSFGGIVNWPYEVVRG